MSKEPRKPTKDMDATLAFYWYDLPEELQKSGKLFHFQPGEMIMQMGASPDYVHFILSGRVKGIREYLDGNTYEYFYIGESDGSVGMLELFARRDEIVATILADTKVSTLRVPSDKMFDYVHHNIDAMRRFLYIVSRDLYARSSNDGLLYFTKGIDRVKFFLTRYYAANRNAREKLTVEMNYEKISASVGISVRTVVRSVRQLKTAGLIGIEGKRITITHDQYRAMENG